MCYAGSDGIFLIGHQRGNNKNPSFQIKNIKMQLYCTQFCASILLKVRLAGQDIYYKYACAFHFIQWKSPKKCICTLSKCYKYSLYFVFRKTDLKTLLLEGFYALIRGFSDVSISRCITKVSLILFRVFSSLDKISTRIAASVCHTVQWKNLQIANFP